MKLSFKATIATSALAVGLALSNPAEAASFSFSYTLVGGDVLAGLLDGDLQADNDTVFVTAVNMPTLNGAAVPAVPFITTVEFFASGTVGQPRVSLSGSLMNLLACPDSNCVEGFLFDTAGILTTGSPSYSSSAAFGSASEPFNSQNWSLTPESTPIPSPAMLPGMFGMGAAMLRKRKAEALAKTDAV